MTDKSNTLLLQRGPTQVGMAHDLDINGYRSPSDEQKQKVSSYLIAEGGILCYARRRYIFRIMLNLRTIKLWGRYCQLTVQTHTRRTT